MQRSRLVRAALAVVALALIVPLAAGAGSGSKSKNENDAAKRILFATDSAGNLLRFKARGSEAARSKQITGLPAGVVLKGIDFRPATGDLYALGSDKVVYRVNPWTAIAVAEGPAFETTAAALVGDRIGFDFNPTVDKIRVTSDADDNLRLDPDPGSLLAKDTSLTPAGRDRRRLGVHELVVRGLREPAGRDDAVRARRGGEPGPGLAPESRQRGHVAESRLARRRSRRRRGLRHRGSRQRRVCRRHVAGQERRASLPGGRWRPERPTSSAASDAAT